MNKSFYKTLVCCAILWVAPSSWANLNTAAYLADRVSTSPVAYKSSYTYQGNTFIRLGAQLSKAEKNIGAYYCSDEGVQFVPVEKRARGAVFVSGEYRHLFIYRLNGAAGLLNGVVRLRHESSSQPLGNVDCLDFFDSVVKEVKQRKKSAVNVANADGAVSDLHSFNEIKTTFEYLLSDVLVYPQGGVYAEKVADWAFNIPFGSGQVDLNPMSAEKLNSTIIPIAKEAAAIKIFTMGDTEQMISLFNKAYEDRGGEIGFSNEALKKQRQASLFSRLILAGVDPNIISVTEELPAISAIDDNDYSADTVIFITPKTNSGTNGSMVALLRATDDQVTQNNAVPKMWRGTKTKVNKDIFLADEGQLLSDALRVYLKSNGYQMSWEVDEGVDWRFDIRYKVQEDEFHQTLRQVLADFPVQAVISSNKGIVRIKMRYADDDNVANNFVPLVN